MLHKILSIFILQQFYFGVSFFWLTFALSTLCVLINWANEFQKKRRRKKEKKEKKNGTKDYFYCSPFVQAARLFSLLKVVRMW